jgi:hypothetical protein
LAEQNIEIQAKTSRKFAINSAKPRRVYGRLLNHFCPRPFTKALRGTRS